MEIDNEGFFDQLAYKQSGSDTPFEQWNRDRKQLLRPADPPDTLLRPATFVEPEDLKLLKAVEDA